MSGMSTIAEPVAQAQPAAQEQRGPWTRERDDLVRGASGGFLFGIPLLYTEETWGMGAFTTPSRMLIALVTTFSIVFVLNRTTGFRRTKDIRLVDAAIDSVETLAIGLICATAVFVLIRELTLTTPLHEMIGKIVFGGVPCAIGAALSVQFLSGTRNEEPDQGSGDPQSDKQQEQKSRINATLADIGATLIGATIISFNIAPTGEIPMIAAATSPPWLLLFVVASLITSYGIVFEAGFVDQQKREQQQGIAQHPWSETLLSYLVALVAAAFLLWFLQRLTFSDPWQMWLSYTLVLGLPTAIGGAAGRLAV